jgi:hypothetical protein
VPKQQNAQVEQLAANNLTIPQDAIASLLQRLVRHAWLSDRVLDGHLWTGSRPFLSDCSGRAVRLPDGLPWCDQQSVLNTIWRPSQVEPTQPTYQQSGASVMKATGAIV